MSLLFNRDLLLCVSRSVIRTTSLRAYSQRARAACYKQNRPSFVAKLGMDANLARAGNAACHLSLGVDSTKTIM